MRPQRATDVHTRGSEEERKSREGCRGGGETGTRPRRRKRSYDRAFLVASIHVSSVTRVMRVGNTRFLESSGAVFSFHHPSPMFAPPSPLGPLSTLPWCALLFWPANSATLFIIVYTAVHTRARKSKARASSRWNAEVCLGLRVSTRGVARTRVQRDVRPYRAQKSTR